MATPAGRDARTLTAQNSVVREADAPANASFVRSRLPGAVKVAIAAIFAIAFFIGNATPTPAATVNACSVATGSAAHVLCWLDLTGYAGTGTAAYQWTLPDGSTLSGNLINASTTTVGGIKYLPVYGNSVLGNAIYTGVQGSPAVYDGSAHDATPLTYGALRLTDSTGTASTSFDMVGADAETTDVGDGQGTGYIDWNTTGAAWTVLQHSNVTGQGCTIVIGGSLGAGNAQCLSPGTQPYSDIYLLQSVLAPGQSVAMSYNTSNAQQGYAMAIELAAITLKKTVTARVATSDQFTVETELGSAVKYSAATTGTAAAASTGQGVVIPARAYTLTETASNNDLAQYTSNIACTNANATSATTLPSGVGTSFTVTPAVDDQITCTFTNAPRATLAKTVTNVTNPNGSSTVNSGKPNDVLQYGLTFTNTTGLTIVATSAHPLVISDSLPLNAKTSAALTKYVSSVCTSPQNGLTCSIATPAVGATTGTITFSFIGTLATGGTLNATFNVSIL